MGNGRNSLRSDTPVSDPFSVPHNRRGSKRLNFKNNGKFKNNDKFKNNGNQILQRWKELVLKTSRRSGLDVGVVLDVAVDLQSAWDAAFCALQKMDQKQTLFEPKASFVCFPFSVMHKM